MPDPFRRGAKVTFAIRRSDGDLRAVLLERIEPMVRYLAAELAEIALQRFRSEIHRVTEALDVAVSAYASASDVRGGGDPPRMAVPEPAVAAEQGSTSSPAPPRAPDMLEQALGPEIAAMMRPPASGPVCSKCKQPGHNARSCGRAPKGRPHSPRPRAAETDVAPMTAIEPSRRSKPPAAEVQAAKARITERRDLIAARAAAAPPREPAEEVDQDDADERWSTARIAEERELAEANKREGELPMPRSSWVF